MSEHRLWEWLRDRLPVGHATRIESEVGSGFPDVHFTLQHGKARGHSVMFELKKAKRPSARIPLKDHFTRGQLFWIPREIEAGGIVFIIAEIGAKVYVLDGLFAQTLDSIAPLDWIQDHALLIWTRRYGTGEIKADLEGLILSARKNFM